MKRTMKYVIGLTVGIALFIILLRTGLFGSQVNEVVLTVSVPVVRVISWPFRSVSSAYSRFRNASKIEKENERLKEKIIELELAHDLTVQKIAQFKDIKELQDIQEEYTYKLSIAQVVLQDNLDWLHTVVINRGTRDGIMRNMAVITGKGLVGKVIETGYSYSRVVLITDRSFRVGARLEKERYTGLLEGRGVDTLVLNYIPRDAPIGKGEKIITSGTGGIFPPGLVLGAIKDTFLEEYGFYTYATITPAVDFNRLETVAVVLRQPRDIDVTPTTEL